ncbi:hypothetical protein O181_125778 [Austropuccinia psidii MF-1]|uniref:Uncharacterized protein n=1 Tax=Austropuccinia psidii MF-1 TaxID=1389203 RepID=A0A9Q3KQA5_9BASI|nr:hypothetical protein [Austropuccinia psidii MF-1]
MLTHPHRPLDMTPTLPPSPPSSLLILPHLCCLQSLCYRGGLKIYLITPHTLYCLPCLRLCSALLTCLQYCPHHSLHFHTPAAHNPYAPAGPSRYTCYATLSHPPITILMLLKYPPDMPPTLLPHRPNPQFHLRSLRSCNAVKMRLQCRPTISALTTPYTSTPLHHFLCCLKYLRSHGTVKICLQHLPQPPLGLILSPPLTILTLRY